jgi:hypothetical protein
VKDRLPEIAKRGVLLEEPNVHEALRKAAEANRQWDYAQEATMLYRRADVVVDRLYPVIHTPSFQGRLPSVLIAIGNLRNKNTLAAYRLVPDDYGINFKITFNEQHYEKRDEQMVWRFGEWAQMETLVHEVGHHWQQMLGKDPYKQGKRVTHNKEFRDRLEQIGIHCAKEGYHTKVAEIDSPFGQLMKEWGIEPPKEDIREKEFDKHWFKDEKKKGRSTLHKWSCPDCGMNVRYTRKDDPMLVHVPCGSVLVKEGDRLDQTIYSKQTGADASNADISEALEKVSEERLSAEQETGSAGANFM